MSTAISFPYNQSVIAFTPSAGTYQNVTFVVCCTGTGLGGGQLEPTSSVSSNSAVNYQSPIPFSYDLDSGGGSNTSLCFLLNLQKGWINQSPPYYFVLGTTSQHLWLYSLTPAAAGEDFTSSNITPVNQVDEFDTEVASLFYYPPLNLLFVGEITAISTPIALLGVALACRLLPTKGLIKTIPVQQDVLFL